MDNNQLKAIVMALIATPFTGREMNPVEQKFLAINADKIIEIAIPKTETIEVNTVVPDEKDTGN